MNDRLNPESPAYFGDDFFKGIEVLVLCNGEKMTYSTFYYDIYKELYDPYSGNGQGYILRDPDKRKIFNISYGMISYNVIECFAGLFPPLLVYEDDRIFTYTFIRYPDGNEDEIKIQFLFEDDKRYIDVIWINQEVAYMRTEDTSQKVYYNPKYFPLFRVVSSYDGSNAGLVPSLPSVVTITKPR